MGEFRGGDENINREGRPKGIPNKTTKEIRDAFQLFVENQQDNFAEWIERVAEKNPAKAIELVTNLGEYILPKLSRSEIKAEIKESADLSKVDTKLLNELDKQLNEGADTSGDTEA